MPELVSCIFCLKDNAFIALQEDGYCGNKCKDCALIYISPRPTLDEIVDLYGHSNARITAQSHITDSLLKRLHARHTLSIIKKYKPSGSILEIGSGGGFFLDEARKKGYEAFGIELNPIQADFIEKELKIPCEQQPLSALSYGEKRFDAIYHCDVISHFHNPIKEFHTIAHKLNDGGLLVFETGNIGDIKKKHYKLFTSFQYPDHLFFFSEANLKTLLEQTGFKLVKVYRYNIVPHLLVQKLLGRLRGKKGVDQSTSTGSPAKSSLAKGLAKEAYHILLYGLRYQLGAFLPKKRRPQTLIVVAVKNGKSD